MTYIFVDFEGYKYWIEVNDEGTALRQVTIDENNITSISCLEPCLADQYVDTENDCEIISKDEFEKVWENAVLPYRKIWNTEKLKYKKGQNISGIIKYFYPQGAVLDLNNGYGCMNIENCREKPLYPGYSVSGTISGYDEENMWILIENCKLEQS